MAINTNNLILKIASRIQDVIDGDTVLLIEQNIPTAILRVTKQLAATKAPGHEMLLKTGVITNSDDVGGLAEYPGGDATYAVKKFSVDDLSYKIVLNENFHDLTLISSASGNYKVHGVNSLSALSLSGIHGKPCYFIKYPDVFVAHPVTGAVPNAEDGFEVTHYTYLPLSLFPDQLEDYLVDDLINLLQLEADKQGREALATNAPQ